MKLMFSSPLLRHTGARCQPVKASSGVLRTARAPRVNQTPAKGIPTPCAVGRAGCSSARQSNTSSKLTAVALANKLARIVYVLATKGGHYDDRPAAAETSRLSRNEVSPQGDQHRGRRRSDVNQRNGSEARGKGQAPSRARFADWARSHADQHQGQQEHSFPRQQIPCIELQANKLRHPKSEDTRSCHDRLIPRLADHEPWAQSRSPMDMMRQG